VFSSKAGPFDREPRMCSLPRQALDREPRMCSLPRQALERDSLSYISSQLISNDISSQLISND
jgi:hypothetical protein